MPDDPRWGDVERYLTDTLVGEDSVLTGIRERTAAAGLRPIEVSATDGALLALWCRLVGARRVLEIGTLGGYSSTWLARAVGTEGRVTTLERDPVAVEVARESWRQAGVSERVELIEGPAVESLEELIAVGTEPYDLVFIDADKVNNPAYLEAAVVLSHPGTLIVVDNVVRDGRILGDADDDPHVLGTRRVLAMLGENPRLEATAIQSVSAKGWDGFAVALVLE